MSLSLPQTFAEALTQIRGQGGVMRIVQNYEARRVPYLLENFLPARPMPGYSVQSATMSITPTLAAPTGMDQPYPQGGLISGSSFLENSAKFTQEIPLSERFLRHWNELILRDPTTNLRQAVIRFITDTLVQAQLDTTEYLRGQAISNGAINWEYNRQAVTVNYGVPAGNILPARTVASTNHYAGPNSRFWEDAHAAQSILGFGGFAAVMSAYMFREIVSNPANEILNLSTAESSMGYMRVEIARAQNINGQNVQSADSRDRMTLFVYTREASIIDPANPNQTKNVPFIAPTKVSFIGNVGTTFDLSGQGAVVDSQFDAGFGYVHLAPTIEGNGAIGRWYDSYTPEHAPWALIGRSASNQLPVIEAPRKLVIAESALANPPA